MVGCHPPPQTGIPPKYVTYRLIHVFLPVFPGTLSLSSVISLPCSLTHSFIH